MDLQLEAQSSSRGPRFEAQDSQRSSKPSITPVLGELTPAFDLYMGQAHMWYTDIQADKTLIHRK